DRRERERQKRRRRVASRSKVGEATRSGGTGGSENCLEPGAGHAPDGQRVPQEVDGGRFSAVRGPRPRKRRANGESPHREQEIGREEGNRERGETRSAGRPRGKPVGAGAFLRRSKSLVGQSTRSSFTQSIPTRCPAAAARFAPVISNTRRCFPASSFS